MLFTGNWKSISAEDYGKAFDRFGGSFATHPRVVALLARLANRPVSYLGLSHRGKLIAAVPVWGSHIVASQLALELYRVPHLVDVGQSEIVVPMREDALIRLPFEANMISSMHQNQIKNLERESEDLTLGKGLRYGARRMSNKSQKRRRLEERNFLKAGGKFRPVSDYTAVEAAAIYTRLYAKRWRSAPLGVGYLPTVLHELQDMLCGDLLLYDDKPVAFELSYKHETPRHLFVNCVQAGYEQGLFREHSLGSILTFHNLGLYDEEANRKNKALRYNLGWNCDEYKSLWATEMAAYKLETTVNPPVKDH